MHGFNWGNLTHEQKLQRDRLEMTLLMEQAAFKASQAVAVIGTGVVPRYLSIPATWAPSYPLGNDFTIEVFANFSSTGGNSTLVSMGDYPNFAYGITYEENAYLRFRAYGQIVASGAFQPTLGQWYHIVVMEASGVVKIFVNGEYIAQAVHPTGIWTIDAPLNIGYGGVAGTNFNGLMSNLRIVSDVAAYDPLGFNVPTGPLADNIGSTPIIILRGADFETLLSDYTGQLFPGALQNFGTTYSANDPFNSGQGSVQFGIA